MAECGGLLWPGDHRAGDVFTEEAFLGAMVRVEQAWLDALAAAGAATSVDLATPDLEQVAAGAESGGNPVIPLVKALREQSADVHRGMTSQDVIDTALVLCLRDALDRVRADLERHARALAGLAREHRTSIMAGRTLTQYAVPITFGLKAATWLDGIAAAGERLARCTPMPAQLGGAAGTLAAPAELAGGADAALRLVEDAAARLDLAVVAPWHTQRSSLTEYADALVAAADAWGKIAGDITTLSRPEIGELREAAGGGSSTMPGKANPVLSVLVRRHAVAAPQLAATLHLAAATAVDERPDGAWHAEWDTLRTLARRSVVAASQLADLVEGLVVDAERMAERVGEHRATLTAEQRSLNPSPAVGDDYLGATDALIEAALTRAAQLWKEL